MKKRLVSIALGLVFAAVPMALYAACADVIVINGSTYCSLSGSSTVNGNEVCSYNCSPKDAPAPQTPAGTPQS